MIRAELRWSFVSDPMLISFHTRYMKAFNAHHICSQDSYPNDGFVLALVRRKAFTQGRTAASSRGGAVSCWVVVLLWYSLFWSR